MTSLQLLVVGVLATAATVIAVLEVAFRSMSRLHLRGWAESARLERDRSSTASEDLDITLTVIRLARQLTLIVVACTLTYGTVVQDAMWSIVWSLAVVVGFYLTFDKALPHLLVSVLGPDRILQACWPVTSLLRLLLRPLAGLLLAAVNRTRAQSRVNDESAATTDLGAILDLVEEEGLVSDEQEELLRGVAHFGEAVVREVMTPRVEIVSINAGSTLADLRRLMAAHRFSRVPVIDDDIDHVVGVAVLKDLVVALEEGNEDSSVTAIARPPLFVPETKQVRDLLREYQRSHAQLTILVDEYGGTAGLVTLEDILEEIVGEIQDEDEPQEVLLEETGGVLLASGKADIEELEAALGVELDDREFETVGGMVFSHLGHVPKAGESFVCEGLRIEVLEADERRVHRVRVTRD